MARILATYSIHPDSTPYGVCWCVLGYLKANILYIEITLAQVKHIVADAQCTVLLSCSEHVSEQNGCQQAASYIQYSTVEWAIEINAPTFEAVASLGCFIRG